ncbi:C-GCAxxG-C-C family protein [Methanonatronarchaeum sp. AMET-Sl]|uniref:C-GCAxxG-C-C family protein n=1 Tax=Methanonatronarchaeum sp. AMET-Sl TaxID=3037654 RepID=UPI00244E3341|nr:C-GCAxxG-C-C family protein [Methanonatronarchaeum sp. AMET-Sl]WGI17295.1 C-GCAxxG-C-C family protein [Methanonatronarchaeum sp. AMET-Sl]
MTESDLKIPREINQKQREKIIEKAEQRAMKKYMRSYNCAESVFETTIEILETEFNYTSKHPKNIVKIATGFGEGVGKYGLMCGAISGGTMALSIIYGYKNPANPSKKDRIGEKGIYKIFNQLPHRFIKQFDKTECYELTKDFYKTYSKGHIMQCQKITSKTAGMVIDIIIEVETKGIESLEFKKSI